MGFKEFLKGLVKPSVGKEGTKKIPEEMELESYLEQERKDRIRALVHEKRKQHNSFMMYKSSYNYNRDVKNHFTKPKSNHVKFSKSNFWK